MNRFQHSHADALATSTFDLDTFFDYPPSTSNQDSNYSDSEPLSETSKKITKKRSSYQKISDDIRVGLLEAVQNGETLKAAAKRYMINYSSAKSILHTYRKEGRILKKSAQERTPKKRANSDSGSESPVKAKAKRKENSYDLPRNVLPLSERTASEITNTVATEDTNSVGSVNEIKSSFEAPCKKDDDFQMIKTNQEEFFDPLNQEQGYFNAKGGDYRGNFSFWDAPFDSYGEASNYHNGYNGGYLDLGEFCFDEKKEGFADQEKGCYEQKKVLESPLESFMDTQRQFRQALRNCQGDSLIGDGDDRLSFMF